MDRYSGRDADLDSAPKQKMTNVERLGIGNMFVRAAPAEAAAQADGGAAAHFSRVEVVPSRREVKRTAATLAMPPPPPATQPAPPSASGYQAPPWASQPPAGTCPRFLRPPPLHMVLAVCVFAVTRGAAGVACARTCNYRCLAETILAGRFIQATCCVQARRSWRSRTARWSRLWRSSGQQPCLAGALHTVYGPSRSSFMQNMHLMFSTQP